MNTQIMISYQGKNYPCRSFKQFNSKEDLICPDSLFRAIFDDTTGWFRDNDAIDINDRMLYTVPDNMISEEFITLMLYILNDAETKA